CTTSSWNDDFW
nr:immunoglobulin heavy chain junction region [Macaca mulatta]MOX62412.1 immunoglobulin heavy chain junction region [Macaca mulatta]MOX67366.1 immunoglobulin heavy chain junction region [Macaca mulatta]MOX68352.1 immunoglobulin heavy chain junction region [Macaca mulatta]